MDYWYLETYGRKPRFDLKKFNLDRKGLRVFDFHPIHLALNTPNLKYYERYKHLIRRPKRSQTVQFAGEGINTLFENLVRYIVKNKIRAYQLKEIYRFYK